MGLSLDLNDMLALDMEVEQKKGSCLRCITFAVIEIITSCICVIIFRER